MNSISRTLQSNPYTFPQIDYSHSFTKGNLYSNLSILDTTQNQKLIQEWIISNEF